MTTGRINHNAAYAAAAAAAPILLSPDTVVSSSPASAGTQGTASRGRM